MRHHSSCAVFRVPAAPLRRAGLAALLATWATFSIWTTPASAGDPVPFRASEGVSLSTAAAQAWAPDAFLVYLENDEALGPKGTAARWGYLFYSPALDQARVYSVRSGKIVLAENLDMRFEAPPLAAGWIDSGAAAAAAERTAVRELRREHDARLSAMLLVRGPMADGDPDATTWLLVYSSPGAPSLFVVVDATDGKVRRTWRG
jgi:dipeptidyl aminopeptidase/acylaminoacyl peptidase